MPLRVTEQPYNNPNIKIPLRHIVLPQGNFHNGLFAKLAHRIVSIFKIVIHTFKIIVLVFYLY